MKLFTAEDFSLKLQDIVSGEPFEEWQKQLAADIANKKLAAMLAEAPKVYFDDAETMNHDGYFEGNIKAPKGYHTHTARLVAIAPIEGEEK